MLIGVGQNNLKDISIITDNKITPWVKDINENITWISWNVTNRDLYFINKKGEYSGKMNLTEDSMFDIYSIQNIVNDLLIQ